MPKEETTSLYTTKKASKALKELKMQFGPIEVTSTGDKILALIDFYNKNKEQ